MYFNLIILTIFLSASVLANVPSDLSKQPNLAELPTLLKEQVANSSPNQPQEDSIKNVSGSPNVMQSSSAKSHSKTDGKQTTQEFINIGHGHSTEKPRHIKGYGKFQKYETNYLPYHEDQVTVYPQKDNSDEEGDGRSSENYAIYFPWLQPISRPTARPTRPSTTINPLLPVIPPLKPIYYPTFYPLPYPVTKPTTTITTTTKRPRPTTTTTTTTTTKRPRPTTTKRPSTTTPATGGGANVEVLESYQVVSKEGITEYKLRLSNGLTDHKKITKKRIGNYTIYVQRGYFSTPIDPTKNKFDLIFYIADERGFRITGVQSCSSEQPCKPRTE